MTLSRFRLGALVACAALAACGGGGNSVPPHEVGPTPGTAPSPTATPTKAPAAKNVVAFSFGAAMTNATKRKPAAKKLATSCSTFAKLTLPAQAFSLYDPTPNTGYDWINEGLQATEYDPSCNAISTAATFTSTPTVTQTTPSFLAQLYPPQSDTVFWGTTPGTGTITATFPDGTAGTLPTATYPTVVLSCSDYYYGFMPEDASTGTAPDMEVAYSAQSRADYCPNNPGGLTTPTTLPDGSTFSGDGIVFPYGFKAVPGVDVFSIADTASVGTFTPDGYVLSFQQITGAGLTLYIVKTSSGAYEKVGLLGGGCGGGPQDNYCVHPGYFIALKSPLSDASGNFAY